MDHRGRQGPRQDGIGLLILVVGTAIIMALGVVGVLMLTTGHATLSKAQINTIKARYAAEAGVAWALDQLWREPLTGITYTGELLPWDFDGDGTIEPGEQITIQVVDPPGPAGRQINVTVTY